MNSLSPFIECIELLSKSKLLRQGDVFPFVREVLEKTAGALECERVNVWMLEEDDAMLANLLSYERSKNEYGLQGILKKNDFPHYFNHLLVNEIIIANNAVQEDINKELVNPYLLPNGIKSMIDVPLRTDGTMIGVICYEHISPHSWTLEEQKFVQSVAGLLSLALETQRRRKLEEELHVLLHQKDILLAEINHRTKNNSNVVLSMINLMSNKSKDDYHKELFDQLKDRIYSLSAVQDQLTITENFDRIDLSIYLNKLIHNLKASFPNSLKITHSVTLDNVEVEMREATSIGLIANEGITNVYKYAFPDGFSSPELKIDLSANGNKWQLIIADNGKGMNLADEERGMGIDLMFDLALQIDSEIQINSMPGEGCIIEINGSNQIK